MHNIPIIYNPKAFIKIYPNWSCSIVISAITVPVIYYGNYYDILLTLTGLSTGLITAPLIELIDCIYDSGLKEGINEFKELSTQSISGFAGMMPGMLIGSFLGGFIAKVFNNFPVPTFNGLILTEGLLGGALMGHCLELYNRVNKLHELPNLTTYTITGAIAGFTTSMAIIHSDQISEIAQNLIGSHKSTDESAENCI